VQQYARLLVERSLGVQPRWQVVVGAGVEARPLVEEVERQIARAGAWPILQLVFGSAGGAWAREAPAELIAEPPPIAATIQSTGDAFLAIVAPTNTREASDLDPARRGALQAAGTRLRDRLTAMTVPWVVCQWPTHALAQDAGMTLAQFEEFLFGACLLDWDAEAERMRRIADVLDDAAEVRIVAGGTDLTLALKGRTCAIDDAHINMPGGEVFCSPVEDATEGVVHFAEFPAMHFGQQVEGIRLRFAGGRVVDASADVNEDVLISALDTDDGARVLGELGIGCNPGITRHLRNTLFDEKIAGTVHLALGASYTVTGGVNESVIPSVIVEDLRRGGELYVNGRPAQRDGEWLATAVHA
jgi:aminopeptidase